MNAVLEVNKLNKSYGNFSLKDVTFSLEKDCITGFIGTNGSGKTTTIKAILGRILKIPEILGFPEKIWIKMKGNLKTKLALC